MMLASASRIDAHSAFWLVILAPCLVLILDSPSIHAWRKIAPFPTLDDLEGVAYNTSSSGEGSFVAMSTKHAITTTDFGQWKISKINVSVTDFSHAFLCYFTDGGDYSFYIAAVDDQVLRSVDGGDAFVTVAQISQSLSTGIHCSKGCVSPGICDSHMAFGKGFLLASFDIDGRTYHRVPITANIAFSASVFVESAGSAPLHYAVGGTDNSPDGSLAIYTASSVTSWTPLITRNDLPALTSISASVNEIVAVGYNGIIAYKRLDASISVSDPVVPFRFSFLNASGFTNFHLKQITRGTTDFGRLSNAFIVVASEGHVFYTSDPSSPSSWVQLSPSSDMAASSSAFSPVSPASISSSSLSSPLSSSPQTPSSISHTRHHAFASQSLMSNPILEAGPSLNSLAVGKLAGLLVGDAGVLLKLFPNGSTQSLGTVITTGDFASSDYGRTTMAPSGTALLATVTQNDRQGNIIIQNL